MDISLRGHLVSNDDADVLRYWGWRDITAPMDIAAGLEEADGEDVTLLINSPGGSMAVGVEIASMLRRYRGNTTALFQGCGASAATFASTGCGRIVAEPGSILCYHCPVLSTEGDWQAHEKALSELRNLRETAINVYMTRTHRTREEIGALLDADKLIAPQQALEYGLIDAVEGLPGLEPLPLEIVAASGGGYLRVTAQMREAYQQHAADTAAAAREEARRARARLEALARY